MPLGDIFKSKEEIQAELKRAQKKELRDANRTCERLQNDLDRQAKDLETQIKTAAKKNDTVLAKTLAKQLIKVRNEKVRAVGAKSKISNISSHASSIQANNKLAQVMAASSSALAKVNQQVQPEKLAGQMNQFREENMKMDMKESVMEDMFDELFDEESDEADSIMNQVLDEIAIDTGAALAKLPKTQKEVQSSTQASKEKSVADKLKTLH